ncbi:MAG: hypothetical protein KAY03_00765 [Arenimonas sp.]|nr:hypothetical protein [Arenimonas sp.]
MTPKTLCYTGFSREEAAALVPIFEAANARFGRAWQLVPEGQEQVLVIDMDSMYGHMSWLKAAGGGKTTVGLTANDRSETDYVLRRPVSVEGLKAVLEQIASKPMAAASTPAPEVTADTAGPAAEYLVAVTTGKITAMPAAVAHEPRVSDFLSSRALGGPAKVQLPGAPTLAFDPGTQTYVGSASLKPLLPYVQAVIRESDVEAIDLAEFERIKASSGGAQPYMRLLWLCGLSITNGELLPGYSPAKKFMLTKWPQIEREFPKHFRLATVMMKGPALVRDLAELSGVAPAEVVAFINAGLLTGSVVVEGEPSAAGDVARAVALLARPRAG